MIEKDNGLV